MISSKENYSIFAKKRNINKLIICVFLIGSSISQSFAQYEIKKYTINSGGAKITGGNFHLQSSIGQVDANTVLTGGDFSLNSGFWQKNTDLIFKNNFEGTGE